MVIRRANFELRKAKERAHILNGYLIALDHLDEVIRLIRSSSTPEVAKDNLINADWGLDELQAKAILELRLQRLTGMEREKIKEEYEELQKQVKTSAAKPATKGSEFPNFKITGFTQLDTAFYGQDSKNIATVGNAQDGTG